MDDLYRSPLLAWLSPKGPEGDVVISSRVRLARNFDRMPFPDRADASQLAAVKKTASALLPAIEQSTGQVFDLVDMDNIHPMEREVLCVKHIVSPNLIQGFAVDGTLRAHHRRAVCDQDRHPLRYGIRPFIIFKQF